MAETWKDYELAAAERLWDGWAVAAYRQADASGALYLLGYVVEMILKAAFFRAGGAAPTALLGGMRPQLTAAANQLHPPPGPYARRDYHGLRMLADALVWQRASIGRPLATLETPLRAHVLLVSQHWTVDLRYQPGPVPAASIHDAWRGADWLLTNYPLLH